jgi:hypothetical protein
MRPSWLYRIASIVLVLFAAGHSVGFSSVDPSWHAEAAVQSMHNVQFHIGSFSRNYWDFYLGFGYFVSILQIFAALVAWQLGGLKKETLAQLPLITWGLAISFVAVVALNFQYFFWIPITFSAILAVLLIVAAWLASRR